MMGITQIPQGSSFTQQFIEPNTCQYARELINQFVYLRDLQKHLKCQNRVRTYVSGCSISFTLRTISSPFLSIFGSGAENLSLDIFTNEHNLHCSTRKLGVAKLILRAYYIRSLLELKDSLATEDKRRLLGGSAWSGGCYSSHTNVTSDASPSLTHNCAEIHFSSIHCRWIRSKSATGLLHVFSLDLAESLIRLRGRPADATWRTGDVRLKSSAGRNTWSNTQVAERIDSPTTRRTMQRANLCSSAAPVGARNSHCISFKRTRGNVIELSQNINNCSRSLSNDHYIFCVS